MASLSTDWSGLPHFNTRRKERKDLNPTEAANRDWADIDLWDLYTSAWHLPLVRARKENPILAIKPAGRLERWLRSNSFEHWIGLSSLNYTRDLLFPTSPERLLSSLTISYSDFFTYQYGSASPTKEGPERHSKRLKELFLSSLDSSKSASCTNDLGFVQVQSILNDEAWGLPDIIFFSHLHFEKFC